MPFLAVDIGNTRLKWALYHTPQPGSDPVSHGAVFLETIEQLAEGDWAGLPMPSTVLGSCVAGDAVRHRVEDQVHELWERPCSWVVSSAAEAGVINGYDHPARLGADRWVALIGARARLLASQRPGPALVVMVGTAVTVDALDEHGEFLGGCILPGHGIMLRALEGGTAGLRVPTGDVVHFPTNTSDALTSGGTYAITGAIERMHRHLLQRGGLPPQVIVTGGAGWKVAPYLGVPYELVDTLLFDGLLRIGQERAKPLAAV
ncbi:type III pantothenate kinase [Ideonella sp. BN130291]|uniref:type III pantothenate kinase n=1 Tax=Ideonella sp. BN130291 TaxID=3112940 RepID=UPI002E275A06|nr:type III pantothenate kinase [Ideonella sp. BN130291]